MGVPLSLLIGYNEHTMSSGSLVTILDPVGSNHLCFWFFFSLFFFLFFFLTKINFTPQNEIGSFLPLFSSSKNFV